MWCFSNTDAPGPILGIHANGRPSRSVHIEGLHVLDRRNGSVVLGGRRDDDGVGFEERRIYDTRPIVPLFPLLLLIVAPGSVGTSPGEIVRTSRLTDFVAVTNGVVVENGIT
jgi:hypothetical protein